MKQNKPNNSKIQTYFALIAIAPTIIAVMAYEFYDFTRHVFGFSQTPYNPIDGIGILIPMALFVELFTFIFSFILTRKVNKISIFIKECANGNFSHHLENKNMAPFTEIVDDLNSMNTHLESVETLKKDFINDFSHEFKTPIASINGFSQLLLEEDVSEEEKKEYLEIIEKESARLSNLAKQTMLMSQLDNKTTLEKKSFSLDEQIKQDIILLSNEWSSKNIEMDIQLDSILFYGDASITSHIWINILNNSIKFTPENGKISVSLKKENNNAVVIIQDSGKGMSEEQITKIFNRYYQTDASHASKGLGLGLSIVHRCIELCKGTITVQSEINKGSSFTITLPLEE